MSIISVGFILFVSLGILIYYIVPQKYQWIILLLMSLGFAVCADWKNLFFIFGVSAVAYISGLLMEKTTNSNHSDPKATPKKKKNILYFSLVILVGILVFLRYINIAIEASNKLCLFFGSDKAFEKLNLFVPIALSYYTLQIISYILDVYWNRCNAEHNYFRLILFTSYFPQMIQGPISRYGQLSNGFRQVVSFNWINLKYGIQLILWGYFKKLVIADRIGEIVNGTFFSNIYTPYGLDVFFGLIVYGIQLYCDFSGGMDIIRGVSECFGINLPENFKQPYFSKSLAEFWRRWHITLGGWMKDYIFYPLSMSKAMTKIRRKSKKVFNRKTANRIPAAVCNFVVFFFVGLWHGTAPVYFAWGIYNGIIIAASTLLVDRYDSVKNRLKINEKSTLYNAFSFIRTFLIITFGWVFDCANTVKGSLKLFCNMLRIPKTTFNIFTNSGITFWIFTILLCAILVFVDILSYKGKNMRYEISKKPFIIQLLIWTVLIQIIICFSLSASDGGFMYENF